ncbi:MAG: hypothetical protein ACJ765_11185 [Chloroflexota bacterium]
MPDDLGQLEINLQVDDDMSSLELEELTAAVQRELMQLDVTGVDRVSAGPAPDGSRGVDLAALGALIVQVGKATPVLGQVVDVIQAWAARSPKRTATLTIGGDTLELGGLSERDQRLVIRDWMTRHAPPTAPEPGMA